jgi:multiple sugar transport system ATP-binding protein
MSTITLEGVSKVYPGGVRAVDEVDLEIHDGEFMVLVGPSGCGKSTLLRMICGLEEVSEGRILIGDRDVTNLTPRDRDIAMVFQNYALYPHMTVRKNLGYSLKVNGISKEETDRRVTEVASALGLEDYLDRKPTALSGGQRQRVAMGRAIVREPKAYLMDEPLSNLDAKLRVGMRAELARLHERLATTTVYVTHDQVEAMTLGQRVAVLSAGTLQQVDTPHVLYNEPANLFVAAFIGSPSMNLFEATAKDGAVIIGNVSLPLPPQVASLSGRVVAGLRPEAFQAAALSDPSLPSIVVRPTVVEDLGPDTNCIFELAAPRADTAHVRAAEDNEDDVLSSGDVTMVTARVSPRTGARAGTELSLSIDASQLYLFDPESGANLLHTAAVTA